MPQLTILGQSNSQHNPAPPCNACEWAKKYRTIPPTKADRLVLVPCTKTDVKGEAKSLKVVHNPQKSFFFSGVVIFSLYAGLPRGKQAFHYQIRITALPPSDDTTPQRQYDSTVTLPFVILFPLPPSILSSLPTSPPPSLDILPSPLLSFFLTPFPRAEPSCGSCGLLSRSSTLGILC